MFRSLLRAFTARTPAQRKPETTRRLTGPELLEDRMNPVTNFTINPLPDLHLAPAQVGVPVLDFTAKGTDWRSALSNVVADDTKQGALNYVRSGTLFYESGPNIWTALDSSPTSSAAGRRIGFNGFGWIPVGDLDGAHFQIRVDTIDAAFTPVHGELTLVAANVRYGGTPTFSAAPSQGGVNEEAVSPTNGGPQRTIYHIVDLPDSAKTVNANSRDQTVFELYVNSSDPRAYANCMRFITKDASGLPFVKTATFYREISPGNWHAMMTVRPDGYGRCIFTVYQVGQQFRTSGLVHLQVRVNTDPAMVGSQKVDLSWYFSTAPYAGMKSFDVLALNSTPPVNPPTHGPLSTSGMFYAGQAGVGVRLADMNIGGGATNAAFDQLSATLGTGSWTSASNITLRKTDSNGNAVGPAIGTITSNNGTTIVITGINSIIDLSSYSFALFADLSGPLQITSVFAIG